MTTNITAVGRMLLIALVAVAVIAPQAVLADSPGTVYTGGSKPTTSYTYTGGSKPTSYSSTPSTSYVKYPTYTTPSTSYVKYPSYSTPSTSYVKYPTTYTSGYSSYVNYPSYTSYSSYQYPQYNNCGYYYDCGSSNLTFSWNDNDNDNDNDNQNGNTNVNNNYNYNSNTNVNNDDDDDDEDEEEDEEPWCVLNVDDRTVDEGDEVTLEWDTRDADYASINQGIGRVDEDGGEEEVEVDNDTTFRMTVRNGNEEDTCSVTVRVEEDEDNDFSSVVYVDEPTQNPPPTVYLSSIPYTGLEDLTPDVLMYWLLLIAGTGALAWYAMSKGLVPNVFAYASASGFEPEAEEATEEAAPITGHVNEFVSSLADGDQESVMSYLRIAAVDGTGVEEFLTEARSQVTDTDAIASKLDAMIAGSQLTGIRGAKEALAA